MAHLQGETLNIEECLEKVEVQVPVVCSFGVDFSELYEFKLAIERDNVFEMPSLSVALHCCFSAYYIYNISYPQPIYVIFGAVCVQDETLPKTIIVREHLN